MKTNCIYQHPARKPKITLGLSNRGDLIQAACYTDHGRAEMPQGLY